MSRFDDDDLYRTLDNASFCLLPGVRNGRALMQHAPRDDPVNKRRLCRAAHCTDSECTFFHLNEGCCDAHSHDADCPHAHEPVHDVPAPVADVTVPDVTEVKTFVRKPTVLRAMSQPFNPMSRRPATSFYAPQARQGFYAADYAADEYHASSVDMEPSADMNRSSYPQASYPYEVEFARFMPDYEFSRFMAARAS
jgi:hypothetical protein